MNLNHRKFVIKRKDSNEFISTASTLSDKFIMKPILDENIEYALIFENLIYEDELENFILDCNSMGFVLLEVTTSPKIIGEVTAKSSPN